MGKGGFLVLGKIALFLFYLYQNLNYVDAYMALPIAAHVDFCVSKEAALTLKHP